jgi:hypothetical protein
MIVATCLLLAAVLSCEPANRAAGSGSELRTGLVAESAHPGPDANCSGELARRVMREAWAGARAQMRVATQ